MLMEINELKEVLIEYGYELVSKNNDLDLYNCGKRWVGHSDAEVYVSPSVPSEEMETFKSMVGMSKISELGAALGIRPNSVVFYPKKYTYSLTVLTSILDSVGIVMLEFDNETGWLYGMYGNTEMIFKIDTESDILHMSAGHYGREITIMLLKLGAVYTISIVDFGDQIKGTTIH